jgi:hypothetical protein
MKWVGHVACTESVRNTHIQNFRKKTEGKRLFRRPGHKWEDNIETYLKESEYCGMG